MEIGEDGFPRKLHKILSLLKPPYGKEAKAISGLKDFLQQSYRPREENILQLGEKDNDATAAFQNYELPDQVLRYDEKGQPIKRCLLDKEEYLVKIHGQIGYQKLGELVTTDNKQIESKVRQAIEGEPKPDSVLPGGFTNLEVIVGDYHYPDQCYRHRLRRIHLEESKVYLIVFPNLELDKLANYYTSRKRPKDSNEVAPSATIINLDQLKPAPPISHQRLPKEERIVNEELWIEIDIERPSWIVCLSTEATFHKWISQIKAIQKK